MNIYKIQTEFPHKGRPEIILNESLDSSSLYTPHHYKSGFCYKTFVKKEYKLPLTTTNVSNHSFEMSQRCQSSHTSHYGAVVKNLS